MSGQYWVTWVWLHMLLQPNHHSLPKLPALGDLRLKLRCLQSKANAPYSRPFNQHLGARKSTESGTHVFLLLLFFSMREPFSQRQDVELLGFTREASPQTSHSARANFGPGLESRTRGLPRPAGLAGLAGACHARPVMLLYYNKCLASNAERAVPSARIAINP